VDEASRSSDDRRSALFTRSRVDRVTAGVAGGLAERLRVDSMLVRIAFVVLVGAGGVGVVAYGLAWALSEEPHLDHQPPSAPETPSAKQLVALGLILFGVLLVLREMGLWFGDALTWPLALAGAGSAVLWSRSDVEERARVTGFARRLPGDPVHGLLAGPGSVPRVVVGGALMIVGLGAFLATSPAVTFEAVGPILVATAVTIAGVALLVGPWVVRLARQLSEERRERIRSEERAEMAAHLHDSVLQTLALIQRSREAREMVTLARAQERELRAWLYGARTEPDSLRRAFEETAARLEALHRVPVNVVCVGDAALDDRLRALVQAAAEAISNAAQHAGAEQVSVYVEAEDGVATAYVTDQGIGFDPAEVESSRLGITESINGRMARHGGEATVTSAPGEGTEVTLRMPTAAP
jgi:signal transduction histidine kinase/phage shock protein PspC (stress-responsive transcriptional regulator)